MKNKTTRSAQVMVTLPEDLTALAKRQAGKRKLTFSRLVGEQLRESLSKKDQESLAPWPKPGRPKS